MNSSGIKRGLATTAVSALAIAGLPLFATSASAEPISASTSATNGTVEDTDLELLNPDQANAPVTTESYNLVAIANADVDRVQFQFSTTGAAPWTNLGGSVARVNGAFTRAWTPSQSGTVRVVPIDASGVNYNGLNGTGDESVTQSVVATLPTQATTVKLGGDTNLGVWDSNLNNAQPGDFAIGVQGTTTNLQDSAASALDDNFAVTVEQRTGGAGTPVNIQTNATGAFSGVLDLDPGYTFPPGGPDQLVIGAEPRDFAAPNAGDGLLVNVEDAAVKTLYLQTLATVDAQAADTSLQPAETTNVTITVTDSTGKPVAGATVYRSTPGGATAAVTGRTNASGVLIDRDVAGTLSGQYTYFVNAPATNKAISNDATLNQPALGDKADTVAINIYQPGLNEIEVLSKFGDVIDLDELDSALEGDFAVIAKDQEGTPLENENLSYTWTVDPFNPTLPSQTTDPIQATTPTDADGLTYLRFAAPGDFDTVPGSYQGEWTLQVFRQAVGGSGAFQADPADFTIGEAEVQFDPAERTQGPLGGSTTVGLSLEIVNHNGVATGDTLGSFEYADDDVAFPAVEIDREAALTYTKGDEAPGVNNGDSRIAPFEQQDDAVIESASGTNAVAHFDEDGQSALKINDASPETVEELDALLTADPSAPVGDAADADTTAIDVDFLETVEADSIELDNDSVFGGMANPTPGRPVTYEFLVENENNVPLSNKAVEVTVNGDAFITDEPTGSDDELDGMFADNGQTATVRTDGNGIATVTVAIERSEDFDDDFEANIDVTASVDDVDTDVEELFRARDAVDLDRVEIVATEGQKADLPDAQVQFEQVYYDVFAYDQFGNLSDEDVEVNDGNNNRADVNGSSTDIVGSSNLDSLPVVTATARAATTQTVRIEADDLNGKDATTTATDAADPINWYAVDFAASTFELQQQGPETVDTGSRVTEVLTVLDQVGQPVEGLYVEFLRSGPGDQDSDGNSRDFTDANGVAYYDFTGGADGTAQISAIVYTGTNGLGGGENRVGTAEDTVTFQGEIDPVDPGTEVEVLISGDSNGGKKDVIRVQVDDAGEGAEITLYKIRGKKPNKRLVEVRSDIVPEGGTMTFKVADRNGNKKTRFIAKVEGDDFTAKSNTQKLR